MQALRFWPGSNKKSLQHEAIGENIRLGNRRNRVAHYFNAIFEAWRGDSGLQEMTQMVPLATGAVYGIKKIRQLIP